MKKILLLCLVVSAAISVYLSQKIASEHFGPEFKGATSVPIESALMPDQALQEKEISLTGTITRQCPSSGCWFFIKDESGNQIKVELGHMGMKFPMRIGQKASVEGRLLQKSDGWQLIGNGVTFGGN